MGLTRTAIEEFISHRITAITTVNASDVSLHFPNADRWVSTLGISHIFTASIPPENVPLALQLVRKTEAALASYSLMTKELTSLVSGPTTWSPYYRALNHAESSISSLYQARSLAGKRFGLTLFVKDDGSEMQRLNSLYNAIKHQVAHTEDPVWITNHGFACTTAELMFPEFEQILGLTSSVAQEIANGY